MEWQTRNCDKVVFHFNIDITQTRCKKIKRHASGHNYRDFVVKI